MALYEKFERVAKRGGTDEKVHVLVGRCDRGHVVGYTKKYGRGEFDEKSVYAVTGCGDSADGCFDGGGVAGGGDDGDPRSFHG